MNFIAASRALLSRFFPSPSKTSSAVIPDGRRVYGIGDIHGRYDLLARLLEQIELDSSGAAHLLVFLGDYLDRGSDSRAVIECLSEGQKSSGWICLKGNHESMFLEALDGRADWSAWLANGGVETLFSYGVVARDFQMDGRLHELGATVARAFPAHHIDFLRHLPSSYSVGDYFFCHAGVRPGIPLDQQDDDDLIWIRDIFTDSDADHGKRVVHGHTPVMQPEVLANRINIDTGAYLTQRLTCVVLEGASVRFLQT